MTKTNALELKTFLWRKLIMYQKKLECLSLSVNLIFEGRAGAYPYSGAPWNDSSPPPRKAPSFTNKEYFNEEKIVNNKHSSLL